MKASHLWQGLCGGALVVGSLWRIEQAPQTQTQEAIVAYRAQDWETSQTKFEIATQAGIYFKGTGQAQKNLALAALQVGELEKAALAAKVVASSGDLEDLAWHDFLLGNLAWKRSLQAETKAHGPIPPAGALELAIAQAKVAQEAWQSALDLKSAWPEAQRNLDRTVNRLIALEEELMSSSGAEPPESEKMPAPPDTSAPPLSEAKQIQLMQQLERLDQQGAAKKAAQKPKPSGGWEW